MNRQPLLDALAALSDEQFAYIAWLCQDAGWRDSERFGALSEPAGAALPPPPPPVVPTEVEATTPAAPEGDFS